jgi:hypothetical protein
MDNPVKPAVSLMFAANPKVARFIHSKYLEAYQGNVELRMRWLAWLRECLGVHDVPRLSNKTNKGLSVEFKCLVNNLPSLEWLTIIRLNWDDYHLSTAPKSGDLRIPSEDVRNRIVSLSVDCTDGKRAKLKDTILPTLRSAVLTIQHMGFHFLDVKDEQNSEWIRFSVFSVITHRDLDFCLKLLMKFSTSAVTTDKMTVIELYRDIHMFCEGSMNVHRFIRVDNQEIRGRPLPANIMLDKDQKVFVPLKGLENNELNNYELSEKLISLCHLEKVSKELPLGILSMSSIQQIEDMLEEHGVIFDKLEMRKLTSKIIAEPAGAMLSSTRKPVADTPPEMVTDDGNSDSGDSDLSSLAALKEIGVRVKLVRKPKPVTAPRYNTQSRSGRANALPLLSTDDNAMEQHSDDED